MVEQFNGKQLETMRAFVRKQEEKLATWRAVLACLEDRTRNQYHRVGKERVVLN